MKRYSIYTYIMLGALLLTVGGFAVYSGITDKQMQTLTAQREAGLQRSYYDMTYAVSAINTDLDKLALCTTKSEQVRLLTKIARNSELAANSLYAFTDSGAGTANMTRYFNQLGDYSVAAVNSLTRGEQFSGDVYEDFSNMRTVCDTIMQSLSAMNGTVREDSFSFADSLDNVESSFVSGIAALEGSSIEYPSLIYDGPFADALVGRVPTALSGEEITAEQGAELVREYFPEYSADHIKYLYEGGADIPSFFYTMTKEDGSEYTLQLAKRGGAIVSMSGSRTVTEPNKTAEECQRIGADFLKDLGYTNMQAVWVSNYNSIMYINYAYVSDGVVYYADLIKVKIAADDGTVCGMECMNYIFNHGKTRSLHVGNMTEEEITARCPDSLQIAHTTYALIPIDTREVLCLEVYATRGEDKYFLYYDAVTGDEVNILRVIDSDNGELLQ